MSSQPLVYIIDQQLGSKFRTEPKAIALLLLGALLFGTICILIRRRKSVMLLTSFTGLLAALLLSPFTQAIDKVADPALNAQLITAANEDTRENILQQSDYLFDMGTNCDDPAWTPGRVCNADKATWPLLTTHRVTVAQLNLSPCAMLPAHLHRDDNVVVAIQGKTHTYMFPEDGGKLIQHYLQPGQMTLFPAMSLHTMINEGKKPNPDAKFSDFLGTSSQLLLR